MLSNYHTHSSYCDGKGEPREYVEFALANGFTALGFSGHAPLPFSNTFSIHNEDYLAYCNEVRALKEEYRDRIDIRFLEHPFGAQRQFEAAGDVFHEDVLLENTVLKQALFRTV